MNNFKKTYTDINLRSEVNEKLKTTTTNTKIQNNANKNELYLSK